tara:strand:- start:47 stop:184 length:138 start_codon:yes stop_codon:yes gene_type:complete
MEGEMVDFHQQMQHQEQPTQVVVEVVVQKLLLVHLVQLVVVVDLV